MAGSSQGRDGKTLTMQRYDFLDAQIEDCEARV